MSMNGRVAKENISEKNLHETVLKKQLTMAPGLQPKGIETVILLWEKLFGVEFQDYERFFL